MVPSVSGRAVSGSVGPDTPAEHHHVHTRHSPECQQQGGNELGSAQDQPSDDSAGSDPSHSLPPLRSLLHNVGPALPRTAPSQAVPSEV